MCIDSLCIFVYLIRLWRASCWILCCAWHGKLKANDAWKNGWSHKASLKLSVLLFHSVIDLWKHSQHDLLIIGLYMYTVHHASNYSLLVEICPKMRVPHDRHREVSPTPNPHLNASNYNSLEVTWKLQIIVYNMKYPKSKLHFWTNVSVAK